MKTLLLMRHAKSSWDEGDVPDHDRPLNTRGEKNAPQMARALVDAGRAPGLIVSSTALRARTTAFAVAEAFHWTPEVRLKRSLYMASAADILQEAERAPDDIETLMLVGHNPGMEDVVSDLAAMRQAMPTAAIAAFGFQIDAWSRIGSSRAELLKVWRAKEID
jgi:phosphohistidine phosphatase